MSEDYTKNDDGELRDYTMYKIIPKDESLQYCYIGHTTNFTSRKNQHKTPCINICLLYTSPSPRDRTRSRMPSSA